MGARDNLVCGRPSSEGASGSIHPTTNGRLRTAQLRRNTFARKLGNAWQSAVRRVDEWLVNRGIRWVMQSNSESAWRRRLVDWLAERRSANTGANRSLLWILRVPSRISWGARTWRSDLALVAADRQRAALPADEHLRLLAIWIVEILTPSTVDQATAGLASLTWASELSQPPAEWLDEIRERPSVNAFMSLGYASNRPRPGMGRVDDLPEEFSMVEVSLSSLTATLTAVVGQFILSTAGSNQIEEALRHEYSPEVRYRQGAFRNFNPPMQQAKAVRDVRQRLRADVSGWLKRQVPGAFAAGLLDGQFPALELLVTEKEQPLQGAWGNRSVWTDAAGLAGYTGTWISTTINGLRAHQEHWSSVPGERHSLVLAGRREELEAAGRWTGHTGDDAITIGLGEASRLLASTWAASSLVQGWDAQFGRARDLAARHLSGWRISRSLRTLRQHILTYDFDVSSCAKDLVALSRNKLAQFDGLRMVAAPYPHRPWVETQLSSQLRYVIRGSIKRLDESSRRLRESLSATSGLTVARSSIRLQRWAVSTGIISVLVAAAAAAAAFLALTRAK